MSQEIENEVKVLLNYKSFIRLLRYFQLEKSEPVMQTNHYFDTLDYKLTQLKAALRIRVLGNTYTLTLKTLLPDGSKLEVNEPISLNLFNTLMEGGNFRKGEVFDQLKQLGIDSKMLRYVNSLSTKRYQFSYKKDDEVIGHFCLDTNTYGDYVDYELEFEGRSIEEAKKVIAEVMGNIGLPFAFNEVSKIERAFNATIKN